MHIILPFFHSPAILLGSRGREYIPQKTSLARTSKGHEKEVAEKNAIQSS